MANTTRVVRSRPTSWKHMYRVLLPGNPVTLVDPMIWGVGVEPVEQPRYQYLPHMFANPTFENSSVHVLHS